MFWAALRAGALRFLRCSYCGFVRPVPSPGCHRCGSLEAQWVAADGEGVIHTFTVTHRRLHPLAPEPPYAVAVVSLDAGPRMIGRVATDDPAGLAIGDARPCALGNIPIGSQVVTVCDRAHEELSVGEGWWHWSVPDPVPSAMVRAFDDVVAELDARIAAVVALQGPDPAHRQAEHPGRMS